MTLTTDSPTDTAHLARIARLQALTTADELLALPQSDRRWLRPAQVGQMHRARFAQWLAQHPNYFPRYEAYDWCQWITDEELDALKAASLTLAQRKEIATDVHKAMGSPDAPTVLDIAEQMRPTYVKWWTEIGCPAAQHYGDHAAERSQHRVLELRYEDHVSAQPEDEQARLRERREAFAALGVDLVAVTALWDDTLVVEKKEPVDLAKSYALTDADWEQLAPYFGEEKQRRVNSVSWRQALDSALLTSNTRTPWRAVERASALRMRLQSASEGGVFAKIRKALDDGSFTVRPDQLRKVCHDMQQWAAKRRKG